MVAAAAVSLSRALRLTGKALAWFALALGLFMLAAWIGSSLPRNADWREADRGIEIMVETNGVHTSIVMPLLTPQKDWRSDFPAADLLRPDRPYTHVSVSWGERRIFLDTPTWADLSPRTTIQALAGGDGLLHVAHYVRPAPSATARVLRLRPAEYRRLVRAVERHLPQDDLPATYPGYADHDVFYDAAGRYHVGNTCNQWTSDTLAAAGVRMGRWTPFAGGVMKWVPSAPVRDRDQRLQASSASHKNDLLTIGELARRTGLSVSAIRFYEAKRLVEPIRTAGNQRRFLRSDIRRLSFILIAQQLGLALSAIEGELAQLPYGRTPTAHDWKRISHAIRRAIDARIATLEKTRANLDGCIGCGCLSLTRCKLYNGNDIAAAGGAGPRVLR